MRIITVVAVLILSSMCAAVVSAASEFSDIAKSRHRAAIETLADRGIIHGYDDGSFRPNAPINRAEFLKILMLAVYGEEALNASNLRCFTDFGAEQEWYYVHACVGKERGIVSGHPDGTFRGTDTVILAEALKMSMEAWNIALPQYFREPDHWYDPYVDAAASRGIFNVLPATPGYPLTRGEAAELMTALDEPLAVLDPEFSDPERIISRVPVPKPVFNPFTPPSETCGDGILDAGEACDDGNILNNDGCSSACYIVPEPVRHGALRVEQRPLSSVSVAPGTQEVQLLAFDAVAGRQDIAITRLKFEANEGSLASAENYGLYLDRDRDGDAEWLLDTAVPQQGILAFSDSTILIREGVFTRLELRADIPSSGTVDDFSVRFAVDEVDYIEGVDEIDGEDVTGIETDNGSCAQVSICWISVYTDTPRLVSIGTQGSLFVTRDNVVARSSQMVLGKTSADVLRLKFRADGEDISVTKITINGGSNSIEALELLADGASSPFATARKSSCDTVASGRFCADTDFLVHKDEERRVAIRARLSPDTVSGTSGENVTLSLTAATAGTVAVEATGEASLVELNQNNGNATAEGEIIIGRSTAGTNIAITGETHDVVGAMIATVENSHPDDDDTTVPAGEAVIAQFRFSAIPHANSAGGLNEVTIRDVAMEVTANNVSLDPSSFVLLNPVSPSSTVPCTADASTGVISVECPDLEGGAISTVIGQGESVDLALRATITETEIAQGTSTVQVSITGLGSRSNPGVIVWDDGVTTMQWVDIPLTTVRSVRFRR